MPWIAGVAAAGAGLIGGVMQSQATGAAADKSIAAQERASAQARADLQPWMTTGGAANTASTDILGLNGPEAAAAAMGNFQKSPGYDFQMSEGLRAVDAGAASKGMLRSGATLKAEQRFGQGLADQDFSDYYNRLMGVSRLGQASAAGTAAGELSTGKGIGQAESNLGQQQASIYGNAAQGIGNAINTYQNNSLYADRTRAIGNGNVDNFATF